MNRKVASLVCAVSLSAALLTGCGVNTNDGGNITRDNNTNGYTANQTRDRAGTGMLDRLAGNNNTGTGTRLGQGAGRGTDTDNAGNAGTTGSAARGTSMAGAGSNGTSVHGYTGTSGYGTTGAGTLGYNTTDDTLVIGNTVIVSGKSGRNQNTNSNFGAGTHVMRVTDEKAIKAIKRVKSKLNTDKQITEVDDISSDIKLILRHAKPAKGGNTAGQQQNTR